MVQPDFEFSSQLQSFFKEMQEVKQSPSKGKDLNTLSRIASTISSLDAAAKSLLGAANESLRYDAAAVTNMLESPIAPTDNEREVSPIAAARQFLQDKKPGSDFESIIDSCCQGDNADQLLGDLNDILMDVQDIQKDQH